MDPIAFNGLLAQLSKEHFSDNKCAVLNSYKHYTYSGIQLSTILEQFPHSSDKNRAVEIISPCLVTLTGHEVKFLLEKIPFASDQVNVIRLVANRIDPSTKYEALDAIKFPSDRTKAREYLDTAIFTPGGYASPTTFPGPSSQPFGQCPAATFSLSSQFPVPPQSGAFPSTFPSQQPGYPPGSCPPGSYPPGSYPSGSYPSGSCPPGSYPPGSYPPGSCPPGSYPLGSYPPGSCPPGSYPPGSYPPGSCPPGATFPMPQPGGISINFPVPGAPGITFWGPK